MLRDLRYLCFLASWLARHATVTSTGPFWLVYLLLPFLSLFVCLTTWASEQDPQSEA